MRPTLIMLVGLSGSGKSTIAKKYEELGYVIHSSDKLREELYNDVNNQTHNNELFNELHKRMKNDLAKGKNVVFDATNLMTKRRSAFLKYLSPVKCFKEAVVIATPYHICVQNDTKRDRSVGKSVISRQRKSFTIPHLNEGFDKISIVHYNERYPRYNLGWTLLTLSKTEQHNPHHTLTIGDHIMKTVANIWQKGVDDDILTYAGLLHDIGKKDTMVFTDMRGNITKTAHYYGHENVSAYEAMFYLKNNGFLDEDIIYISNLIQYHMQIINATTDSAKSKLINKIGQKMYMDLIILHECDMMAK